MRPFGGRTGPSSRQPWPPWDSPNCYQHSSPAWTKLQDGQGTGSATFGPEVRRARATPSNETQRKPHEFVPSVVAGATEGEYQIFVLRMSAMVSAGGVVHPDGVPVAMDVLPLWKSRPRFASVRFGQAHASLRSTQRGSGGRPQGRSGSYSRKYRIGHVRQVSRCGRASIIRSTASPHAEKYLFTNGLGPAGD